MGTLADFMNQLTDAQGRTPDQALVNAMCLSVAADGEVTNEELEQALGMAMDLPGLKGKPQGEVEKYVERAFQQLKADGMERCMVNVAKTLATPEEREHAFTLAAAVQYIDGGISEQENEFLAAFRDYLDIDPDRADAILADIEKHLK